MNKSDSITNLAKSLASFQSEVKNPSNTADNPFFKSKYAPLCDILNDVRPLLSKHGLSVIQAPGGDGQNIIITTLLLHESGEYIEADPLVLKAKEATAQGAGSAITYGRRYALSAILGISSEDDDDGNGASQGGNKNQKQQPKNQQGKPSDQSTEKPVNWLNFWTRIGKLGYTKEQVLDYVKVADISDYDHDKAMELYNALKREKEKAAS